MSYKEQDKELRGFLKDNAAQVPASNLKASDVWRKLERPKSFPKGVVFGSLVTAFTLAMVLLNANNVSKEEVEMVSFLSEKFSEGYVAEEDVSDDFLAIFNDQ